MNKQTTTIENRVWEVEPIATGAASASDLVRRGFVGQFFAGVSKPVGRQTRTYNNLFIQVAKTGQFVTAL